MILLIFLTHLKDLIRSLIVFEIISFVILGIIIIALLVERHLLNEQFKSEKDKLLEELSRAVKAVIAKNANDYVMTTSIDKVAPEEKPQVNNDLVDPDTLSDDEFMQTINKELKEDNKDEKK
jgi:hypothetical protein